jgi:peptide-methionine (S)-S-oxide reductase
MKARYAVVFILAIVIAGVSAHRLISSENTKKMEATMVPEHAETATFAAGCFWGVQSAFSQVKGVISTEAGYTGGHTKNPTYKDVCTDRTGHAESVLVVYDPTVVSYDDLLRVFWAIHDPTTFNRQGPDFGSQYRSVIFYHSPEQKAAAVASEEALAKSGKYKDPIVTEIVAATTFYRAEEYHQNYLKKHGEAACPIPKFQ